MASNVIAVNVYQIDQFPPVPIVNVKSFGLGTGAMIVTDVDAVLSTGVHVYGKIQLPHDPKESQIFYTKETKAQLITMANVSDSGGSLPSQTGHAGQYLTTDGTNASWAAVSGGGVAGITGDLVSGTATNPIVNLAGTLGADRTVDLNGKVLRFQQGGTDFLNIDPTAGSETATLQVVNNTGGGNQPFIQISAANAFNEINIQTSFNGGAKSTIIDAYSDATTSTITLTAEHFNFVGLADFATNAAAVSGGLAVGDLYYTNTAGQAVMKVVI